MISFHDARRALDRCGITMSNLQLNNFLNELLPNPQSGFSCEGATVWGDSKSIDKVRDWNHLASTITQWRSQVDSNQQRAMRAEELGIQMLAFITGLVDARAVQFLEDRGIEPHKGFFHSQDAAIADARTKFYDAAHRTR